MTWEEIFKLFVAMLSSLGGGAFIVYLLSGWLGKIWATKIVDKYKLEVAKDLEKYKSDLENIKNDYQRFNNRKFIIIEETWSAMHSIVEELAILNTHKDYSQTLIRTLEIVAKYGRLINKNSLYFDDEIQKSLNDYISSCAGVNYSANEALQIFKEDIDNKQQIADFFKEVSNKAVEREKILKQVKEKFKKELEYEASITG